MGRQAGRKQEIQVGKRQVVAGSSRQESRHVCVQAKKMSQANQINIIYSLGRSREGGRKSLQGG